MSTDTKNFFLFWVDFLELLRCLCFTKGGLPFVFAQKTLTTDYPKFGVGIPVVRTDGGAGGRSVYGHVFDKFSRLGSLPHFLTHCAPLRALRERELCYQTQIKPIGMVDSPTQATCITTLRPHLHPLNNKLNETRNLKIRFVKIKKHTWVERGVWVPVAPASANSLT